MSRIEARLSTGATPTPKSSCAETAEREAVNPRPRQLGR
jgi:hypothetical protein